MDFSAHFDLIVGGKFKLIDRIASDGSTAVYNAVDIKTGHEGTAKLEKIYSPKNLLHNEASVCKKLEHEKGFPKLLWYGRDFGYNILISNRLGPSIKQLFQSCSHEFSLKTVLMLSAQMINLIEQLHRNHFVQGDIKPDSFYIGVGEHSKQLFLSGFGLSKQYRLPATLSHQKIKENLEFCGNARFASANALQGISVGRRDDMESLGYVLVYLLKGRLPWQLVQTDNKKEKVIKILEMKTYVPFKELCEGLPSEFRKYLEYCRRLEYKDEPDYKGVRKLFCDLFIKKEYQFDDKFDWDRE